MANADMQNVLALCSCSCSLRWLQDRPQHAPIIANEVPTMYLVDRSWPVQLWQVLPVKGPQR